MDRYELAWAAGFFDGEGWANAVRQKGRTTGQPHAQINQAGSGGVPEVLTRFRDAVGGLGRICGPYVVHGRKDLYRWTVSRRDDVDALHHLLLPWLGDVKLLAIGNALGRMAAHSRAVRSGSDEWRAWAAGLFDGEGCASLRPHRSHPGYVIGEVALTQAGVGDVAPEVLRRLLDVVGRGHINGPYVQRGAGKNVYRWKVQAQNEVEASLMLLLPWLGTVKREQASRVVNALQGQPPLPRGNPEWGNRKEFCVNGHDYAGARLRRSSRVTAETNHVRAVLAFNACVNMRDTGVRRKRDRRPMATADPCQSS